MYPMTLILLDYTQDMHTVFRVSAVAVVILGLLFFGGLITELHSKAYCTQEVFARIIDIVEQTTYSQGSRAGVNGRPHTRSHKHTTVHAKLEYECGGQTYTGFLNDKDIGAMGNSVGEEVPILINSDRPTEIRGKYQKVEWVPGVILGVVFLVFLGVMIYARLQY